MLVYSFPYIEINQRKLCHSIEQNNIHFMHLMLSQPNYPIKMCVKNQKIIIIAGHMSQQERNSRHTDKYITFKTITAVIKIIHTKITT